MQKFVFSATATLLILCGASLGHAIPKLVNYQGMLTDAVGNPIIVSTSVQFRLWDADAGGNELWLETQSVTPDAGGRFSVLLGSIAPVPDSAFAVDAYLGVTVDPDGEMTPRSQIVAVGYAYRVNTVDGATGGTIVGKLSIGPGHSNIGTNAFVAGANNSAGGMGCTVTGGSGNNASFPYAVVGGGLGNIAVGDGCVVGGGIGNESSSHASTVGGGNGNSAVGWGSTVGGGQGNDATRDYATISGGMNNSADHYFSTVSGGINNKARGAFSTVSGGGGNFVDSNVALGSQSTIGGGARNVAAGDSSVISGGVRNTSSGTNAAIGGGAGNTASGAFAPTISGGFENTASGANATISGGAANTASGLGAAIVGGDFNSASGESSFLGGGTGNSSAGFAAVVAGGSFNQAGDSSSTVSGGTGNLAEAAGATVGGGVDNTATGKYSTVPGGRSNHSLGIYSLASGHRAKANHDGAFVWGDASDADVASSTTNEWTARASGGVRFYSNSTLTSGVMLAPGDGSWSSVSDRSAKENVAPVDGDALLATLSRIPVATWNYRSQDPSIRHIGPMAQDFYSAFGVGADDKHITTIDADGVALAAIQALNRRLNEQLTRQTSDNEKLRAELAELREMIRAQVAQAR